MNNLKKELKELSPKELSTRVDSMRRELFSLRLQSATNAIKDKSLFKKLRRNIALGLTLLNESSK